MKRRGAFILLSVLSIMAALLCVRGASAQEATVYRDQYGVPSIVAKRLPDAFYALGYAMAQDNAERMALNYKQARGRLAEVEGARQLTMDGFLQALGVEEFAERRATELPPTMRLWMERFLAGANRSLAERKGKLPDWIEPFTLTDVLALSQLLNCAFPLFDIAGQLTGGMGSNQFAVGAKRSATGHAILSIDPHLPWSGPLLWVEFAFYAEDIKFRGITTPGLPFGVMGHTDKIAWCMTNNDPDLFDFFTVKTNPNNPKQYNYHGAWRDFETKRITLQYREKNELKSRQQSVIRTAWGPMVPFRSQAVRLAPLNVWGMFDQILAMTRAKNATEFRKALQARGLSMWNIVFADTKGNIGYQYNAHLPKRDASLNWSKPVDGGDPKTQWGDLFTLDELPHAMNPPTHLLVNANSDPLDTTLEPNRGALAPFATLPSYVTTYQPTTRFERLAELLRADSRVSLEAAKRYATDTEVPAARQVLAALQQAAAQATLEERAPAQEALGVLTRWNRRADTDAVGCGLYYYWLRGESSAVALARKAQAGVAWSGAESAEALKTLGQAATRFRERFGRLDAPWGEVHVLQRGAETAGFLGFGLAEFVSVMPAYGSFAQGRALINTGSSFRMIVHLNPKGVESWSVLPFGVSQDPANPHYADQMHLFRVGRYKETRFGVPNARRYAVATQTLKTGGKE